MKLTGEKVLEREAFVRKELRKNPSISLRLLNHIVYGEYQQDMRPKRLKELRDEVRKAMLLPPLGELPRAKPKRPPTEQTVRRRRATTRIEAEIESIRKVSA